METGQVFKKTLFPEESILHEKSLLHISEFYTRVNKVKKD